MTKLSRAERTTQLVKLAEKENPGKIVRVYPVNRLAKYFGWDVRADPQDWQIEDEGEDYDA